jgi:hypothetical protein
MGRASPRDRDDFERAPVSARETSTHSSVKGGSPSVPPLLPTGHAIFDRDLGSPKDKSDSNNIATKRAESARMAPRRASTPRAGSPRAGSPRALPESLRLSLAGMSLRVGLMPTLLVRN